MGQLGDLSPQGSVAVGILVGLLSTSIQSLGLTLQRKSHLLEDEKDATESRRPPYKRRRWQLGMFMFVSSNIIGSTIQITTLPLPVLSTLQASGLVFNTAFATLLLNEPFTRFSVIGTILTCTGAALIAIFGAIGEPAHSLSQLLELLGRRQFIIWMAGTLVVVVGTIVFAHVLKMSSSHKYSESFLKAGDRASHISFSAPNFSNMKRSFTATLPQPLQRRMGRLRLIRGLCYALISGVLSAHSLLLAKSAVELLVRTVVDHNNQFTRYQSWLILLVLLFFALSQLYYLHLGLRLCSTSVLYPFVFCIYNIIAILDGLIYFRQASRLSALHSGLIAVGTVVLLSGVLALSWRLDDSHPSDPLPATPSTSLAPGMGLISSPDDVAGSPILPTSRRRSSTPASRRSVNEQTPLIYRRPTRTATLTVKPPPPDPDTRDIWAELDDSEDEYDFLASLPRTPSPYLTQDNLQSRHRSRGDSISSSILSGQQSPKSQPTRLGSSGSEDNLPKTPQRRSTTMQYRSKFKSGEYRRSSAPGAARMGLQGKSPARTPKAEQADAEMERPSTETGSGSIVQGRRRSKSNSAAVRFANSVVPSRWDDRTSGGDGRRGSGNENETGTRTGSGERQKTEGGFDTKKGDPGG